MSNTIHPFTKRQYMVSPDFEYFHYKDHAAMEVDFHNHEFYEIYIPLSGRVTYLIEGNSYKPYPWDILLINNKELHRPVVESGQTYERIVIWVNPSFAASHSAGSTNLRMCFESPSHGGARLLRPASGMLEEIKSAVSRFEKACTGGLYGSDILKSTCLTELLVYLNAAFLETAGSGNEEDIIFNERISSIIQYINKNITEDLSLDILADKFYTSKYHLLREFKKYSGFTLHKFILQKRLLHARALLREGMSVSEACAKSGFRDYSNFVRTFRQEYGVPPRRYGYGTVQDG